MTDLGIKIINYLKVALKSWVGSEDYSDIDCSDIALGTGLEISTVKGVIGSLAKKDIFDTGKISVYYV